MPKKLVPGCLARIVNSESGNNGKVVQVVACLGQMQGYTRRLVLDGGIAWRIFPPLPNFVGGHTDFAFSDQLVPIDDGTSLVCDNHATVTA